MYFEFKYRKSKLFNIVLEQILWRCYSLFCESYFYRLNRKPVLWNSKFKSLNHQCGHFRLRAHFLQFICNVAVIIISFSVLCLFETHIVYFAVITLIKSLSNRNILPKKTLVIRIWQISSKWMFYHKQAFERGVFPCIL